MRRFQFRLQGVLRLEQQRERQAEIKQRQAQLRLEQSEQEVLRINQLMAQHVALEGLRADEGITTHSQIARCRYLDRLHQLLVHAQEQVRSAEKELQQAAAERAQSATEVEALRHLRNKAWLAHRSDCRSRDQHALDEQSLQRWTTPTNGGISS